jgi:phosphoglycolate phosphatase
MRGELPGCILFDLDGTLVDSLAGIEHSARKAFSACQVAFAVAGLRDLIGPPIRTILSRAGNVTDHKTLDALEREFRSNYDNEGWRNSVCFPQVDGVLRNLRQRGHRLFIVSNKPRHISLRVMEKEGILNYFEEVITPDSRSPNYTGKDQMITTLLHRHCIAVGESVMIGDTSEDANAAAAAGISFIWMKYGYGNPSQLASAPVSLALDDFPQLLSLLTKEPVLD